VIDLQAVICWPFSSVIDLQANEIFASVIDLQAVNLGLFILQLMLINEQKSGVKDLYRCAAAQGVTNFL
jgi:hypothetical protein